MLTARQTPAPNGPISQGECLLAAIGMRPVVTHEIEEIDDLTWRRARDMEHEVAKAVHRALEGHEPPESVHVADRPGYMSMLRDLSTPYQPEQVAAMLEHVPEEMSDAAGEFVILARKAFSFLGSQLPRQVAKSLSSGAEPLRPPATLMHKFDSLFAVLDDPDIVPSLASSGALSGAQVSALAEVYPTLTTYMRQQVALGIVKRRGEDPTWHMPFGAESGFSKLIGADLTSPVLKKILQIPPQQPQAKPQPGASDKGAALPMQLMTHTQKADNQEI